MKKVLSVTLLFFFCHFHGHAQNNDLFIVFNEASWCKYCKAHGQRIHQLIDGYAGSNDVLVISNDVTDEETRKRAVAQFEELGIQEYMQYKKEAATVFVFDARTSKIADKFSIKLEDEKILSRLDKVLAKVRNS